MTPAPSPLEVARQFVARINAHDVHGLVALMPPDHRFVDSLGADVRGLAVLREAWRQYFRMVPDYHIAVERAFHDGPQVLLVGVARGTYTCDGTLDPRHAWTTPGAWRAMIKEGGVVEWQVYADNEPSAAAWPRCTAERAGRLSGSPSSPP